MALDDTFTSDKQSLDEILREDEIFGDDEDEAGSQKTPTRDSVAIRLLNQNKQLKHELSTLKRVNAGLVAAAIQGEDEAQQTITKLKAQSDEERRNSIQWQNLVEFSVSPLDGSPMRNAEIGQAIKSKNIEQLKNIIRSNAEKQKGPDMNETITESKDETERLKKELISTQDDLHAAKSIIEMIQSENSTLRQKFNEINESQIELAISEIALKKQNNELKASYEYQTASISELHAQIAEQFEIIGEYERRMAEKIGTPKTPHHPVASTPTTVVKKPSEHPSIESEMKDTEMTALKTEINKLNISNKDLQDLNTQLKFLLSRPPPPPCGCITIIFTQCATHKK